MKIINDGTIIRIGTIITEQFSAARKRLKLLITQQKYLINASDKESLI
jgi:hypothetical protein